MAEDGTAAPAAQPRPKSRILEALEVIAKLIGASAVLVVALFANSLQSRLTGVSIQSQREQAESQLRAGMFSSLISPIGGSQSGDKPMPADREMLLAELLALNFNENFEMKPLMEDAVKRIVEERGTKTKDGVDPREALWSIASRISERQNASIGREWYASESAQSSKVPPLASLFRPWKSAADSAVPGCKVYYLNLDARMDRHGEPVSPDADCQIKATFGDIVDMKSPDGNYALRMVAVHPDWENQTIRVSSQPYLAKQKIPRSTDTQYNFTLSWLDLPLTDNTLLSDGNRYAAYLRTFYSDFQTVTVKVMWFPRGYFTPRERPLNYTEVQDLWGRK
jgi:hypothetical protein